MWAKFQNGLIGKYSSEYDDYHKGIISDMVEAFNPEDYIEHAHRSGGPKKGDFKDGRMRWQQEKGRSSHGPGAVLDLWEVFVCKCLIVHFFDMQ